MNTFTLYWRGGKRQVVTGDTIDAAFTNAGYGNGAMRALDFYASGDDTKYTYNQATHSWDAHWLTNKDLNNLTG